MNTLEAPKDLQNIRENLFSRSDGGADHCDLGTATAPYLPPCHLVTRPVPTFAHGTNTTSPQNGRAGERGITLTRPRCRSRWPLTCRPSPGHCETLVEPPCLPQSSCAVVNMAFIITHRTTPCGRKMALPWVSNINALWTLSSKWNHHPQIALCNKLLYLQCSCHCLWIGCRYRSYVNGTNMLSLPTISKEFTNYVSKARLTFAIKKKKLADHVAIAASQ